MSRRRSPRTAVGLSASAVALVGLLASPAAAAPVGALTHAPTPVTNWQWSDFDAFTLADFQSLVQSKLDRSAARLASDQAQWAAVPSSTVLGSEQRYLAWRDLTHAG